jgi:hypothetical protein
MSSIYLYCALRLELADMESVLTFTEPKPHVAAYDLVPLGVLDSRLRTIFKLTAQAASLAVEQPTSTQARRIGFRSGPRFHSSGRAASWFWTEAAVAPR